jgi:hypothetical protein
MTSPTEHRKLAAILFTERAGSGALLSIWPACDKD